MEISQCMKKNVVSIPETASVSDAAHVFIKHHVGVFYVRDFGAVETTRPPAATLAKSIKSLMQPPISVPEDCGLLRAYALMLQHKLHDILVVTGAGKLVGIASRVDIGTAILSAWSKAEKK
jgi:CBS domain-containing protein